MDCHCRTEKEMREGGVEHRGRGSYLIEWIIVC